MKKIVLAVHCLIFSSCIYAVDYTSTIRGPITFNNGDTVIIKWDKSGQDHVAVSDTTSGGAGIHVKDNGAVTISASATGSAGYNGVSGVYLGNSVANDLGTGSTIKASVDTAANANALTVYGKTTSLTATDLTINATSAVNQNALDGASGLYIIGGATVNLKGNNNLITATNGVGVSLGAQDGTNNSGTSLQVDKVTIDASGTGSKGVYLLSNTKVDLGNNSRISSTGKGSFVIDSRGGTVTAKNLTVISEGEQAQSSVGISAMGGSTIDIDGGNFLITNGVGISAADSKVNLTDTTMNVDTPMGGGGIVISNGATADLDNVSVNFNGIGAAVSITGGKVNAHNLTATGQGTYVSVIDAEGGGQISLTGDTTIINKDQAQQVAIYAYSYGGTNSRVDTGSTGSKMTIDGTITAEAISGSNSTIDLTMLAGSTFTGYTQTDANSVINLDMTDTLWSMTNNSNLTELTTNNSYIDFKSTNGTFYTLQTAGLAGNSGTFRMSTDLAGISASVNSQGERVGTAGVNGDLLTVTDTIGSGNYHLQIINNGAANTQGNEVLQVVQTPLDNVGNFALTKPVEAGAYEYGLRQSVNNTGNKTGWELYSTGRRTTTAEAATSFINTNYLLSYVDTQTLLQRMGELRGQDTGKPVGGLWIRGFGGKLNSFAGNQLSGFDMSYSGTQLGIDKKLDSDIGQVYVGVMAGMTHANPNYRDGDGTTKDYHLGLYGTFIADNGVYLDGVAKYTYMKNHFSVKDTQGNNVRGKGTSSGYSLSVEAGKRFTLATSNFYLEPQAQITYGHQAGMSINASNGLKVKLGNYNYTLGRASGIVGYEIKGANPINIYFKTGYVREMDSSTQYKLNNQVSHYNARGGWWDNGIGVTAEINKRHHVYSDINYAKGSRFDQRQFNLGYRYSF